MILIKLIFFFSSRRRHTRWPRDWSSDVCSSDLGRTPACDDGPVRSGIIFRAAASRGYAVGSWVIAGALLVAFLSHGGLAEVIRYGALPLALAVAGWALFWRPEVRVRPGGAGVVNVVRTSW